MKKIFIGDKLSRKNIWVKRPGTGDFKACEIKTLFGKVAKQNIKENILIKKSFIK